MDLVSFSQLFWAWWEYTKKAFWVTIWIWTSSLWTFPSRCTVNNVGVSITTKVIKKKFSCKGPDTVTPLSDSSQSRQTLASWLLSRSPFLTPSQTSQHPLTRMCKVLPALMVFWAASGNKPVIPGVVLMFFHRKARESQTVMILWGLWSRGVTTSGDRVCVWWEGQWENECLRSLGRSVFD